jgi:hypothetical protein
MECTFRRCVDQRLFDLWEEVISIVEGIVFSGDDDEFHLSDIYFSQSLYGVINFKGATPVFVSAIWKLNIPFRVHFFYGCYHIISF